MTKSANVAVRPLLFKPHRLDGLSERLVVSHYVNNYGGALRRLNAIEARLAGPDWPQATTFEINGLKREELVAAGSVMLHEVYFDGLGGGGGDPPDGPLARAIARDFGTVASWRAEFTAMAKAEAGGSGWTVLAWSERLGRLVNQWAADHAHSLPGGIPILALDMYEHAYQLDFGAHAAAYVDQMMVNLHWARIEARYRRTIGDAAVDADAFLPAGAAPDDKTRITVEELRATFAEPSGSPPALLDVCLSEDLSRRSDMLPGARLHAPAALPAWSAELPRDRPIVVYCVYGFQVSGETTQALRQRGYNARQLVGGIAAWHAIGGPTVPLDLSTFEGEAS